MRRIVPALRRPVPRQAGGPKLSDARLEKIKDSLRLNAHTHIRCYFFDFFENRRMRCKLFIFCRVSPLTVRNITLYMSP